MIKSATVYHITSESIKLFTGASLAEAVPEPTIVDPGKTAWSSSGFSRPAAFGQLTIFETALGAQVFNVQTRDRVLPSKVVNTTVAERAADLEERQGRRLGKKERAELKGDVINELLPTSHIKPSDVLCMVVKDFLIIGTTSAKTVDMILNLLRLTFDCPLAVYPIVRHRHTATWLASLLLNETTESGLFHVGEAVALKGTSSATARYKDVDLSSEAVQDSVANGMRPVEIAVQYQDRMTFSLTDNLIIKRIRFSDMLLKQAAEDSAEGDAITQFDATIALIAAELRGMLDDLLIEMPAPEIGEPDDSGEL